MRFALAFVLCLLALPALATDLTVSCQPTMTMTDGTPISAGAITGFNIWGGMQGQPLVLITPTLLPTCSSVRSNVNPGTICYAATELVGPLESAQSPQACATTAATQTPSAPGTPTVSIVTTSTIAYMIVAGADTYSTLIVGSVPLGVPCNANERLLNLNVIPRAAVVFTGALKPVAVLANCS